MQPGQESERSAGGARTGSGQGRGFKGKPAENRGLAEFPGGSSGRKERRTPETTESESSFPVSLQLDLSLPQVKRK